MVSNARFRGRWQGHSNEHKIIEYAQSKGTRPVDWLGVSLTEKAKEEIMEVLDQQSMASYQSWAGIGYSVLWEMLWLWKKIWPWSRMKTTSKFSLNKISKIHVVSFETLLFNQIEIFSFDSGFLKNEHLREFHCEKPSSKNQNVEPGHFDIIKMLGSIFFFFWTFSKVRLTYFNFYKNVFFT